MVTQSKKITTSWVSEEAEAPTGRGGNVVQRIPGDGKIQAYLSYLYLVHFFLPSRVYFSDQPPHPLKDVEKDRSFL
jgi:hypothetical protein